MSAALAANENRVLVSPYNARNRPSGGSGETQGGKHDELEKRYGALAAVVAAAALLAPTAQAETVTINPFFGCAGGTRYVPAGSDITLRIGWATVNRGLTHAFELAETTTLTIDGAARADADDDAYRTLFEAPDGSWNSRWMYPTGITLAAGESFTFAYDSLVSERPVSTRSQKGGCSHTSQERFTGGLLSGCPPPSYRGLDALPVSAR